MAEGMVSERELAYAAGIVDGEGSIGIYKHSAAKNRDGSFRRFPPLRVFVSVSQCDIRLPVWMKERFGGHVSSLGIPKTGRRPAYQWGLHGSEAIREFLTSIQPHLLIKREQATVALEFIQLGRLHIPRYATEGEKQAIYAAREDLRLRICRLNVRSIPPQETKRPGSESSCDSPTPTGNEPGEAARNEQPGHEAVTGNSA